MAKELTQEIAKLEETLEKESANLEKNFSSSMENAAGKVEEFNKTVQDTAKNIEPVAKALHKAGEDGVDAFKAFDDIMRQIQAGTGATQEEMEKLSAAAREMGTDTKFSATEAAKALAGLCNAGYDADTAVALLPGVMTLAATGSMDIAAASNLAVNAMKALGGETEQVGGFIDTLAAASQNSKASMAEMGDAVLAASDRANAAKLDLAEMGAALAVLADNGMKGSAGGKALGAVLGSLLEPSEQGAAALMNLGVSVEDAEGNMRGLHDVLGDLDQALAGMADVEKAEMLAAIFDESSISAFNALLKDGGERWNELSVIMAGAEGTAQSMADTLEGGIGGAMRSLDSAMAEASLAIGEVLAPVLQSLAELLRDVTQWFNGLTEGQKQLIITIGALVGGIVPVLSVFGQVSTGISGLMNLSALLTSETGLLTKGVGLLGNAFTFLAANPVGLIIAAVAALVAGIVYLWNTNETFRDTVIAIWEGIQEAITSAVSAVVGFFTETIPEIAATVVEFFTTVMPGAITSFLEYLLNLPENLGYLLGALLAHFIMWCGDTLSAIGEWIDSTLSSIVEWGENLRQKAKEAISQFLSGVEEFLKTLPERMDTWCRNALEKIGEWGGNIITWAGNILPGVVDTIAGFFASLPDDMLSVGADLVKGIWNGITNTGPWLLEQVGGFCKGVIQGFKDNFKIKSPSRVMAGIGVHIMEGLSAGMDDAGEQPVSRMAQVAEAILLEVSHAARMPEIIAGRDSLDEAGPAAANQQVTNNYSFHSPVAMTPAEARRQMQKAQRSLLMLA